ncbi:MAG: hypothetical protein ACP5GU_06955 [Thermoprotei archaeon]
MSSLTYSVVGIGSVGSLIAYALNYAKINPYLVIKDDKRREFFC